MNNDQIKGVVDQTVGKAKEAAGKATGNKAQEADGKTDQVKGTAERKVGEVKDAVR